MSIIRAYQCDACKHIYTEDKKDTYVAHLKKHATIRLKRRNALKEYNNFIETQELEKLSPIDLVHYIANNFSMMGHIYNTKRFLDVSSDDRLDTSFSTDAICENFDANIIEYSESMYAGEANHYGLIFSKINGNISESFKLRGKSRKKYIKISDNLFMSCGRYNGSPVVGIMFVYTDPEENLRICAKLKLQFGK